MNLYRVPTYGMRADVVRSFGHCWLRIHVNGMDHVYRMPWASWRQHVRRARR